MIRGRVLVIEGDEWLSPGLGRVLSDAGWTVEICSEARAGFQKALQMLPDCIVCAIDLPDIDGFWVARRIRTEAGIVAKTPLLFVGDLTDRTTRIQGLHVGADVVLGRPITDDDIAAQVEALVGLARRFRGDFPTAEPSSISHMAAIRGDLSLFPLASFLMMLEMERRTGTLDVKAQSGTRAKLTLSTGLFSITEVGGVQKPALDVLREVLSWRAGHFSFRPRETGSIPPPRASVGALVLEAMRLEDEKKTAP